VLNAIIQLVCVTGAAQHKCHYCLVLDCVHCTAVYIFITSLPLYQGSQYRCRGKCPPETTLLIMNGEQKAGISGHRKLTHGVPLVSYVCMCVHTQLHMCAGEQLLRTGKCGTVP